MAQDFIVNVGDSFNLYEFTQSLIQIYRSRGFNVSSSPTENGLIITLAKELGGANTVLGLGTGIKINLSVQKRILSVSFSDEEWTSKITAICLGLFFSAFVLPVAMTVTGVIGITRQLELGKTVQSDVTVILSTMQK